MADPSRRADPGPADRSWLARARVWPREHPRWWLAIKWVAAAALLAFLARTVAGGSDELRSAAETLSGLDPLWIIPAVAAELGSFVLYALAQRVVLSAGRVRVGVAPLTMVALAGQAASNVVPGGVATSSAVMYRQLRRRGVPDALTASMLVIVAVLYGAALAALALIGAQLAGPDSPIPRLGLVAAAVAVVLVAVLISLAALRRRLVRPGARDTALGSLLRRLSEVRIGRGRVAVAFLLLAGSWLASALTLLAAFKAVHVSPPGQGLLVAYCAGQLAASLPITPGGLGVAEGSLTVALVAFGGPDAGTLAAVLLYRLVAYWGLLPTGAAAYLLLRMTARRRGSALPGAAPGASTGVDAPVSLRGSTSRHRPALSTERADARRPFGDGS